MLKALFFFSFLFSFLSVSAQSFKIHGIVTNTSLEPLAFASVQVKGWQSGTITKEDGSYEIKADPGRYELVVTMIGYKPLVTVIIVEKKDYEKNIILEEEASANLSEVVVKGKLKDKAEEYVRNVIRHKEEIISATGAYTSEVYIKAIQEDSITRSKKKIKVADTLRRNAELERMAMAEIVLTLDRDLQNRTKEVRKGVSKRGSSAGLFYLTTTDGDFNFYNNILKVPAVSDVPLISPVSYSGLLAYKYKTLEVIKSNNKKVYVIGVSPRQLSNATVEGKLWIEDSSWVVLHTSFSFPKYHLPEYDFFEVQQDYEFIQGKAWMITHQLFTYTSKAGKQSVSGTTTVHYRSFELNKVFDKKYFGAELSATAQEAYERDSSFWQTTRTEPLREKELRFIRYKDSIYAATHSKVYLDSVDALINKTNWKKITYQGQTLHNHEKKTTWVLPSLLSLYQPIQFGGTRIDPSVFYDKQYKSRKTIAFNINLSYGLRNKDLNGSVRVTHMYNPFNRGFFRISAGREFNAIFAGDAWINQLKRSNVYLNSGLGIGHGLELLNGLFFYTDLDINFRRSVSDYKTNSQIDSLLGNVLENNQAVDFESYNALYGKLRLQYTPGQKYIREPKEKIILGSKWPTFYVSLRKGVEGIFNSKVNFDYLEFGIEQTLALGTVGNSSYTLRTGNFPNQKDLRLVDYKFQRRGDPLLFLNPKEAFQALDSTFPVFKRFYEMHYLHEFNGFFINKIPFMKKLELREVAGAGFLIAPERNLRYAELFTGIERVFKWPFNPLTKFKLGVYVVGSAANQFRNPVQFKVGLTTWDRVKNKWF